MTWRPGRRRLAPCQSMKPRAVRGLFGSVKLRIFRPSASSVIRGTPERSLAVTLIGRSLEKRRPWRGRGGALRGGAGGRRGGRGGGRGGGGGGARAAPAGPAEPVAVAHVAGERVPHGLGR